MAVTKDCTRGIDPSGLQETLDSILDRVNDRAIGAPISSTGLVERFRYQPDRCRLIVFCRYRRAGHAACLVINDTSLGQTLDDLRQELERVFPRLEIDILFTPEPQY